MTAGHTPLPWCVGKAVNGNWVEAGAASLRPVSVARTFHEDVGGSVEDANAEFIVWACNNHYELLGALQEARDALHKHYVDWDGEPEDAVPLQLARARCEAAIAKATGK